MNLKSPVYRIHVYRILQPYFILRCMSVLDQRLELLNLVRKERNLQKACISHLHFDHLTSSCI